MDKVNLISYGLNDKWLSEANSYEGLYVGRVLSQYKGLYKVICKDGEILAEVSGKFRFKAESAQDFPCVGDFVMLDRTDANSGNAIIMNILSRSSIFLRSAAGTAKEIQVVAVNVDIIFICMSLNSDWNMRRLERYLSISWSSGALPIVVLTKADLCDDIDQKLNEVSAIAVGVDIVITSAIDDGGYEKLKDYIKSGQTIAFMGSSGVGKSSLINCLMEEEKLQTSEIRDNEKGSHTTTRRELFLLKNGAMVIDTPGMREIGVETVDLSRGFSDIDELASMCKFSDCSHTNEPKCEVRRAIQEGIISEDRLENYRKLKREAKYENLNSKQIEYTKRAEILKILKQKEKRI